MDPVPDFFLSVSPQTVPVGPPPPLPWYSPRRLGYNFLTLSIVLHVGFGLVAAFLIVATITSKKKPDFQAPGPKGPNAASRALEHKVSMAKKQNTMSAPPNAKRVTTTGVSQVALPAMPSMPKMDVVVPMSMSGMSGSTGGLGGFGNGGSGGAGGGAGGGGLNFFGLRNGGQGLVGTFYDFKQNRGKGPTNMTTQIYAKEIGAFIAGGWNTGIFAKYFQGPQPVTTQRIFIPTIPASQGPAAFGLENEVQPSLWVVHYKGFVSPTQSGTYHFVGGGDDVMMVRFNGKLVLSRNWDNPDLGIIPVNWRPQNQYDYRYPLERLPIPNGFAKGDGISVEAGTAYPMEVLIGEECPPSFFSALMIQKDGDSYPDGPHGHPVFPVFSLTNAPLPPAQDGAAYAPHADKAGPVWRSVAKPGAPSSVFSR